MIVVPILESRYIGDNCSFFDPLTPDSAKSKIDRNSRITNWVKLKTKQHHSKVLLNSFPMNGHTLGFCPLNQKSIESKC